MSALSGLCATIIDKDCLTHGKTGVIEHFDKEIKLWELSFDAPWVGWYTRDQFRVDRRKSWN